MTNLSIPANADQRERTPPPNPPPLQNHTPNQVKLAGTANHSSRDAHMKAAEIYATVVKDSQGHYQVGMDPLKFLDQFMPWGKDVPLDYKRAKLPDAARKELCSVPPTKGKTESSMYPKYQTAFAEWPPSDRRFEFRAFPNNGDPSCDGLKIDLATYNKEDIRSSKATDFASMQTQAEFKPHLDYDPFQDPPKGESFVDVEPTTSHSEETRGQITTYAGISLSMSYRTHIFSVAIFHSRARLIRWDRSSAIVSHSFDYTQQPDILAEFYLRYEQLSDAERGFDRTVTRIKEKDAVVSEALKQFNRYERDYWHGLSGPRRVVVEQPKVWYNIQIGNDNFIVPNPLYDRQCCDVFTRATRRSLAYHVSQKRVCFIKDYWYEPSPRTEPESYIYDRLKAHNVRNIADKVAGGDVPNCITWKAIPGRSQMRLHRLVLETIARELATFGWAKVLLTCSADAAEAISDAYHKAGVMHRDISASNIMIYRNSESGEWKGIVIDWDLCIILDRAGDLQARSSKTGTYQFISAHILSGEPGHTLVDDLESIIWVLAYMALFYLPLSHDLPARAITLYGSPSSLYTYVASIFDNSPSLAGESKANYLNSWASGKCPRFAITGFTTLLVEMAKVFRSRYDCDEVSERLNDHDWFISTLRSAARAMPPPSVSERAVFTTTQPEFDFKPNMMIGPAPGMRKTILSGLHPSRVNGLDGQKRSYRDDGEGKPQVKRVKSQQGDLGPTKKRSKKS